MISTGISGLDKVITGLQLGDNVVWQINAIDDYKDFTVPFVKEAIKGRKKLVYIRFANHKPLLEKNRCIKVYKLDAFSGFESFSTKINSIIKHEGEGVFYVFDCLSDLLSAWSNDLMIGNFFKITCPYLFELNTVAYFSLLRNNHSFKTIARIRDTTQLLIDVYQHENNCYIHPLKVWNRYTPTMFLPHIKKDDKFIPIASSVETAKLFSGVFTNGAKSAKRKLDYWDRLFMEAEDLIIQKNVAEERKKKMVDQLCRLIIAREEKLLKLANHTLNLEDFLNIKSRMIGTGFIGGKTVGMLIARNILLKNKALGIDDIFEPHDSFYIGSDVFYTYIVENGWWNLRMQQKTKEGYFKIAGELKKYFLSGVFPEEIKDQFIQIIEYFGQSPIIVRSSSLLEDSFGNAFAGKYESIFLPNQGPPEERYTKFVDAVRRIYASTMEEDALSYRLQRGLDQMDEQMALLVQRVSGTYHNNYFFPDAAGVGMSYNVFVWNKNIDPYSGMLRLVFGLGTRAVNRVDGDYPRVVALSDPMSKPYAGAKDTQKFSQHYVDVLNLKENVFQTLPLNDLLKDKINMKFDLITLKDYEATEKLHEMGIKEEAHNINFDKLFSKTKFTDVMQKILNVLRNKYEYPVDIEFTVNFKNNNAFQINLLQCRPMQTRGLGGKVEIPKNISKEKIIFQSAGNFLGGNFSQTINKIIYVDPKAYNNLASQSEKYDIARIVGELNRQITNKEKKAVMLLGPGRWGTTTPSLGVPVSFAEINNITVLGEITFESAGSIPEISFGTHFFQDLVETGIFYIALSSNNHGVFINEAFLKSLPKYGKYDNTIKVFEAKDNKIRILADIISQKVICYFK
jgi:hypothetical protein